MKTILSYKDWAQTKVGESPESRAHVEYLKYVSSQYTAFVTAKTATDDDVKSEYTQFVKELKNLFESNDIPTEIDLLNFNNVDELRFSIPYFAEKLKSTIKNISENRNDPKNTASAYANIDSIQNLQCGVYDVIANIHTSNGSFPELATELSGIKIEIQELFDDTTYMDRESDYTASQYYDVSANEQYYTNNQSIPTDLISWTLQSGFNPLTVEESQSQSLSSFVDFNILGDTVAGYRNTLSNTFLGESQYILTDSTDKTIAKTIIANNPIQNPLNRFNPSIATIPLINNTYTLEDVGDYYVPNSLGRSIFLGKNRTIFSYNFSNINTDKSYFPDAIWTSNGVSLGEKYQASPLFANPTLNWMDIKYNNQSTRGVVGKSRSYQEMIPYKTEFERTGRDDLGISRFSENIDPWTGQFDTQWADETTYPIDFRILYSIPQYSGSISPLVGSEYNWGIDVYGNNYALYKPTSASEREYLFRESGGEVFIRGLDGYILPFSVLLEGAIWQDTIQGVTQYWDDSQLFGSAGNFKSIVINDLKEMQIYYNTLFLVGTGGNAVVQDVTLSENGLPVFSPNMGYDFLYDVNSTTSGDYVYFDHFYDDREKSLYVATTKVEDNQSHIRLYKWQNSTIYKLLDTKNMLSSDLPSFSGEFVSYKNCLMDINQDKNELILCFTYKSEYDVDNNNSYIGCYVYKLNGVAEFCDTFTIHTIESAAGSDMYTEERNIIDINYFDNNLLFVVEGINTGNKYLQILEI